MSKATDEAMLAALTALSGKMDSINERMDGIEDGGGQTKKKATPKKGSKQEINMGRLCGEVSYIPKDDQYAAMISVDIDKEKPLMMGVKKAAKILANADAIEAVIRKHYTIVE